jgi:hypothetical protein
MKKRNYDEMDWTELVDDIAIAETKDDDTNRQVIVSTLITIGNECDCLDEIQTIFVKLLKYNDEADSFPEVGNWFKEMKEFKCDEK